MIRLPLPDLNPVHQPPGAVQYPRHVKVSISASVLWKLRGGRDLVRSTLEKRSGGPTGSIASGCERLSPHLTRLRHRIPLHIFIGMVLQRLCQTITVSSRCSGSACLPPSLAYSVVLSFLGSETIFCLLPPVLSAPAIGCIWCLEIEGHFY